MKITVADTDTDNTYIYNLLNVLLTERIRHSLRGREGDFVDRQRGRETSLTVRCYLVKREREREWPLSLDKCKLFLKVCREIWFQSKTTGTSQSLSSNRPMPGELFLAWTNQLWRQSLRSVWGDSRTCHPFRTCPSGRTDWEFPCKNT